METNATAAKAYLAMRTMTLRGSLAMVRMKSDAAGPKAISVQPKNSIKVMVSEVNR
jgi:hypothetical protein